MKSKNYRPSRLEFLYLAIIFILFSFIVFAPALINGPVYLTKRLIIAEETIEGALLFILFLLGIWIFNLYKNEVRKHQELIKSIIQDKNKVEERLSISDQYIGSLNVQIQEIYTIFNNINKYPETKSDLKKTFRFFGERVLCIVNTNWVLFRIIDNITRRTICESFETRNGYSSDYPHVSNKMILEKQTIAGHTSIISNPQNLNIFASCIMPIKCISNEQRIFIQAIINEITKLFVILNSTYYKKEATIIRQ
jgi:hypothetical protein